MNVDPEGGEADMSETRLEHRPRRVAQVLPPVCVCVCVCVCVRACVRARASASVAPYPPLKSEHGRTGAQIYDITEYRSIYLSIYGIAACMSICLSIKGEGGG